ncbi:SAM-dependent methyltransferase [Alkalibacillus flavidus]|uniref:SAM-dependent methyltransferase n=1 Tax=Alkalibacillus flavidus TaxID=546021 RepID=A0ABV2KYC0_9BACI
MYGFYDTMATEILDLNQPVRASYDDVTFYQSLLEGVPGRILVPAVGNGRVMIPLIEAGFRVDGMDAFTDRLDLCKDYLEAGGLPARLFQGYMHTLQVDVVYDAIVVSRGSFQLIEEWSQAMLALEQFYHHLIDGGRLIVDLEIVQPKSVGQVETNEWDTLDGDVITKEDKVVAIDHVHQFVKTHAKYERWHRSQLVEAELERVHNKWYGVEEMRLMLERVGFQSVVLATDYQLAQEPNSDATVISFVATK